MGARNKGSVLTASEFRKDTDSLIREMLNPVNSLRSDRTGFFTHFTNRSRVFSEIPAECQAAPLVPNSCDYSIECGKNQNDDIIEQIITLTERRQDRCP